MFSAFILCVFCVNLCGSYTVIQIKDWADNASFGIADDFTRQKVVSTDKKEVNIKLYYECHCPGCMAFETTEFKEVIEKLSDYVYIQTYPYGNAETHEDAGKIEFTCQHGPRECYGNRLHACALDIIKNHTHALLFNSCMMNGTLTDRGSDDKAADMCGEKMMVRSKAIKTCAKGDRGSQLLKYYGEESAKAHFLYVPYVLINGMEYRGDNFFRDVCGHFSKPPEPCNQVYSSISRYFKSWRISI